MSVEAAHSVPGDTQVGNFQALPPVARVRFQLPGALVVALILPVVVRCSGNWQLLLTANILNTIAASFLMILIGYFAWRRLEKFPTVEGSAYVFWAILPAFLLVIAALLIFRLEYNRALLLASLGMSISWFLAVHFTLKRNYHPKFAIVAAGQAGKLQRLDHLNWLVLKSPDDFRFPKTNSQGQVPNSLHSWRRDWGIITPLTGYHGIVADLRHDHSADWEEFFARATLLGVPVYHYKQLEELLTGKVSIELLSENSFGSLLPDMTYLKVKQIIDFVAAVLLLPLLLPVLGVIAALIAVRDGRPVFYIQDRIGYRGEPFKAYKFRTMQVSSNPPAEKNSKKGFSEASNPALKPATGVMMTQPDDPRITDLGRFLRRTRLDELPQIINILKGEMSWIGPRPEAIALTELYRPKLPFYQYRHAVRPGISGWAQVNQGHVTSVEDVDEKLKYDFFYIKHVSPWLDFLILLRTVGTIFSGFGAK